MTEKIMRHTNISGRIQVKGDLHEQCKRSHKTRYELNHNINEEF